MVNGELCAQCSVCRVGQLPKQSTEPSNPQLASGCIADACCADIGIAKRVGGFGNLHRLREIKARYDPDNMFRRHHFTGLASPVRVPQLRCLAAGAGNALSRAQATHTLVLQVLDKGKADVALS